MRLHPQGLFLEVVPIDDTNKTTGYSIVTAETSEDYFKYRVVQLGDEAKEDLYIMPGDFILAQKKDVNEIKYNNETFYLVSKGFTIKISEE